MAVLDLRFCARAFSSCGKRGPLFIVVRGPLTIVASLVEHRLQTRRLSNCGSRAQPLRGMWDLPRPGHEPVSPALAGRLPTTAPPGKPLYLIFIFTFVFANLCALVATVFHPVLYMLVRIPAGNKCCVPEGQLQRIGSRDCGQSGFRGITRVANTWAGNSGKPP